MNWLPCNHLNASCVQCSNTGNPCQKTMQNLCSTRSVRKKKIVNNRKMGSSSHKRMKRCGKIAAVGLLNKHNVSCMPRDLQYKGGAARRHTEKKWAKTPGHGRGQKWTLCSQVLLFSGKSGTLLHKRQDSSLNIRGKTPPLRSICVTFGEKALLIHAIWNWKSGKWDWTHKDLDKDNVDIILFDQEPLVHDCQICNVYRKQNQHVSVEVTYSMSGILQGEAEYPDRLPVRSTCIHTAHT